MGCSSEYKTVLRHPEFRKKFHRQILEGPVRKRDASCSFREWSKVPESTLHVSVSRGGTFVGSP